MTFSSAPDLEFCRLSRSCQSFVSSCQRKPAVPYPIPDQNGQSVFPFSDKIVPNSLSFGAVHAYIAYMGEYPPPGLIGHTISPFRVVKYMRFRVSGAQGSEQLLFSVLRHGSSKCGTRYCTPLRSRPFSLIPRRLPFPVVCLNQFFFFLGGGVYFFPSFVLVRFCGP